MKLIASLRERGMLTVQAGDNVVRLLPPLIIGEDEIDLACATIDAACIALKSRRASKPAPFRDLPTEPILMPPSTKHFLDLDVLDAATLRAIVDTAAAHQEIRQGAEGPRLCPPARCWP